MKKRLLLPPLLVALACNQSGVPPPTGLLGTNSSVISGSLLFVTSSQTDELRVLDIEPATGQRDFVRAPNPLRPLSVPVVPSPVELSTPTRYGPLGQPLQGDWVFARGAGSSAVSIVAAPNCPQSLREFARIAPRPDSVVTALTSRLTADDLQAQLYFATFDGTDSTLWELLLPNQPRDRTTTTIDPKFCPSYPASFPPYSLRPVSLVPGAVITALLALPTVQHPGMPPDPEERRVVVASRLLAPPVFRTGNLSEEGVITLVDPAQGGFTASPFPLVFNPDTTVAQSYPVKRMVTHGNVVQIDFTGSNPAILPDGTVDGGTESVILDAGTRVFAILDESSCGGNLDCVGVLAVDLDRPAPKTLPDGGTATVFPVAIDGFDNARDVLDDAGMPIPIDGGFGNFQAGDTYFRAPEFFDGGVRRDANRMLPVRFGNSDLVGIIQDVAIQANGIALYVSGAELQYGLLGFVTLSGVGNSIPAAQIYAFDAMTLRQINFAPNNPVIQSMTPVLNNGATATFRGGPTNIQVAQGIWPYSETVFVLYEGIVGSIAFEPLDAGLGDVRDGGWPISINNRTLVQEGFAEAGDIIVPVDSTGTECPYGFPILATPDGGLLWDGPLGGLYLVSSKFGLAENLDGGIDGGIVAALSDGTPATIDSCPDPYSYNLRSSGLSQHAFTVNGVSSGYLGRVANPPKGSLSKFAAGASSNPKFLRFWRPSADAGYSAATLPSDGLSFTLEDIVQYPDGTSDAGVEDVLRGGDVYALRGSGYEIIFLNGYTPAGVSIDSATLGVAGLNLPGALAVYQREIYPLIQNAGVDRVFVLYPPGNVILDFSPTTVTFSAPNVAQDIGIHY
ncbi:MAG TPA: hypothetical protein VMH40_02345 [Myxococcaceae bacterium]|nr:hypothetical protein [Myxococcaceae bacterium]